MLICILCYSSLWGQSETLIFGSKIFKFDNHSDPPLITSILQDAGEVKIFSSCESGVFVWIETEDEIVRWFKSSILPNGNVEKIEITNMMPEFKFENQKALSDGKVKIHLPNIQNLLSPDDRYWALLTNPDSSLCIFDLSNGTYVNKKLSTPFVSGLSWAENGSKFSCLVRESGVYQLYVAESPNFNLLRLGEQVLKPHARLPEFESPRYYPYWVNSEIIVRMERTDNQAKYPTATLIYSDGKVRGWGSVCVC